MEKTTETLQANKTIAKQFFDYFEKGNINQIQTLWGKNYKLHFPGKTEALNVEDSKQILKSYNTAFPDLKFKIQYQIAEGDMVVTTFTCNGTNKGEFQGHAASNKKVTVTGIGIHKIVNNKIEEEWAEFDALGMMMQMGLVPEMEQIRH